MNWNLYARDQKTEKQWKKELSTLEKISGSAMGKVEALILIDSGRDHWQEVLAQIEKEGKSVILVLDENELIPTLGEWSGIDDLLVYPFRLPELLSKVKNHQERVQNRMMKAEVESALNEVHRANETLERILQVRSPKVFAHIKGINIMTRHLTGLKPGGDYFDIFESEKKDYVNILLADSSSYGISSALLGMILSSSARIANDANMNPGSWIRAIYKELKVTLGEQDHLSVFFGRLNRKDFSLHYQLYGTCEAFIVEKEGEVHPLEKQGRRMSARHEPVDAHEKVVHLNPKDRIVLLSDGFVNGVGGEFFLQKIFHDKLDKDPFTLVTELSYQIKSKLVPGETFPGEDCSAIVLDIENRVLRLAPTG